MKRHDPSNGSNVRRDQPSNRDREAEDRRPTQAKGWESVLEGSLINLINYTGSILIDLLYTVREWLIPQSEESLTLDDVIRYFTDVKKMHPEVKTGVLFLEKYKDAFVFYHVLVDQKGRTLRYGRAVELHPSKADPELLDALGQRCAMKFGL